ncbi:MAG: murein transglycosylase A [Rhodospirillaceae bacterium]|nr:murein transglycosylase A [Rhodospirillaceae bacterium]
MQRSILQLSAAALVGAALGATAMYWLRAPVTTEVTVQPVTPPTPIRPPVTYDAVAFASLPGWTEDSMADALPALRNSCEAVARDAPETMHTAGMLSFTSADLASACTAVMNAGTGATSVRLAVEQTFQPYAVSFSGNPVGTFTGYYEATLRGSLTREGAYQFPLYGLPQNLITVALKDFIPADRLDGTQVPPTVVGRVVDQKLKPYFTRAEIDAGNAIAEDGTVVAWVDSAVDAHVLHIQGSGQVMLPDGTVMRVGYAGNNGHSFKGLGRILINEKVLPEGGASMIAVRDWLKQNPDRAAELMNQNARYIFFRKIEGDGPIGAQGVALTPGRSLAVDPRYVALGLPLWLDTVDPDNAPLQKLVVAQDVGAAITGAVRGDYFWGAGEGAFAKAARMKSQGRYYVLLPRTAAKTAGSDASESSGR